MERDGPAPGPRPAVRGAGPDRRAAGEDGRGARRVENRLQPPPRRLGCPDGPAPDLVRARYTTRSAVLQTRRVGSAPKPRAWNRLLRAPAGPAPAMRARREEPKGFGAHPLRTPGRCGARPGRESRTSWRAHAGHGCASGYASAAQLRSLAAVAVSGPHDRARHGARLCPAQAAAGRRDVVPQSRLRPWRNRSRRTRSPVLPLGRHGPVRLVASHPTKPVVVQACRGRRKSEVSACGGRGAGLGCDDRRRISKALWCARPRRPVRRDGRRPPRSSHTGAPDRGSLRMLHALVVFARIVSEIGTFGARTGAGSGIHRTVCARWADAGRAARRVGGVCPA